MKNERLTAVFTLISSASLFPCFFNTKCVRVCFRDYKHPGGVAFGTKLFCIMVQFRVYIGFSEMFQTKYELTLFSCFPLPDLFCFLLTKPEYNASIISYVLIFLYTSI